MEFTICPVFELRSVAFWEFHFYLEDIYVLMYDVYEVGRTVW